MRSLRSWLRAKGFDGILVLSQHNRFYLSGFLADDLGVEESAGALLVLRRQHLLLTDGRYVEQARQEAPGWPVVVYRDLAQGLKGELGDGRPLRLAYEPAFMTCRTRSALEEALPQVVWLDGAGFLEAKRATKERQELAAIEDAVELAEQVMAEAERRLIPGVTERELAAWIVQALSSRGDGPSFPPIVASGPNAALPHATPTGRALQQGEPIIIDLGARLRGYCSDMTRTFFIGEPSDRWKEVYSTVWRAQRAAISACRPGVPCREVDRIAREVIEEAGFGPYFCHATGHGVGIAVHEAPSLSRRNRRCLRPGNVVTVEPGIYLPGEGGVRLEAMVLVTEDGPEEITGQGGYLRW